MARSLPFHRLGTTFTILSLLSVLDYLMVTFNSQHMANNSCPDLATNVTRHSDDFRAKLDSDTPIVPNDRVTGVILAGGQSRRMGQNKALLEINGTPIIERTFRSMKALFSHVILVTNTPALYDFLSCPSVPDIYPNAGSIAGLHAGLHASPTNRIFVVPCDMPFLNQPLIQKLSVQEDPWDALVPISHKGIEPLHACYRRNCIELLESDLNNGKKKLMSFLKRVSTRYVPMKDCLSQEESELAFCNLNHPKDFENLLFHPIVSRYSEGSCDESKEAGRK